MAEVPDVVRSRHTSRIHLSFHDVGRTLCGRQVFFDERLTRGDVDHWADYATCGWCLAGLVQLSPMTPSQSAPTEAD